MAYKLYPPYIEGVIPAFYGDVLRIPFVMNKTVSPNDIKGYAVIIKSGFDGSLITTEAISTTTIYEDSNKQKYIEADVSDVRLTAGQVYKIQVAYISTQETVGYYSSVSSVKYLGSGAGPTLRILDNKGQELASITGNILPSSQISAHCYHYMGQFECADASEKVATYKFEVYDSKSGLIKTTGELVHDSSQDVGNISVDTFDFDWDLAYNRDYYIVYTITTISQLTMTVNCIVRQGYSIDADIKIALSAKPDEEEGSIVIKGHLPVGAKELATGTFRIVRASDKNDFLDWTEICSYKFIEHNPEVFKYHDFTVENGVTYKYAFQQYNSHGVYSNKNIYVKATAVFEHIYLYDGERQLKVKFNPKVSSFKDTLLETKTNTIGSKYPIVFKNGAVKYKDLSISGLISCQSDDNKMFMKDVGWDGTSNLTHQNIAAEKEFNTEVYEWLINGKPKLFRSPTEGNYVVRLFNVSLSPVDAVGRMLHTFTANATEIADNSNESLQKLNILWGDRKLKAWPQIQVEQYTNPSSIPSGNAIALMVDAGANNRSYIITTQPSKSSFSPSKREWQVAANTYATLPKDKDEIIIDITGSTGGLISVVKYMEDYSNISFDNRTSVIYGIGITSSEITTSSERYINKLILSGSFMTKDIGSKSSIDFYYLDGESKHIDLTEYMQGYYEFTEPEKTITAIKIENARGTINYLEAQ